MTVSNFLDRLEEELEPRLAEKPGENMACGKEGSRGAQAHRADDARAPGGETDTGAARDARSCRR